MREVVFKHLTSPKARKKDIFLKEVFEKDGVVAKTERRCFYFIKEITHLKDDADLQKVVKIKNGDGCDSRRHFHIYKMHNDQMGEDKLICKIIGTFYAIVEKNVYTIVFLHSFKVTFVKATLTN